MAINLTLPVQTPLDLEISTKTGLGIIVEEFIIVSTSAGAAEPTVQATEIIFSSVLDVSMVINFTDGDGTSRIVVARAGAAVSDLPADLSSYTANNAFGSGDAIGSGFVVASGSGPFTITGLTAGIYYHYRVFEFNGSGGTENYFTDTATGNPRNYAPWDYLASAGLVASWAAETVGFFTIDGGNLISRWNAENDDGSGWYLKQDTGAAQATLPTGEDPPWVNMDGVNNFFEISNDAADDNILLAGQYTMLTVTQVLNDGLAAHYFRNPFGTDSPGTNWINTATPGKMRSQIGGALADQPALNITRPAISLLGWGRSATQIRYRVNGSVENENIVNGNVRVYRLGSESGAGSAIKGKLLFAGVFDNNVMSTATVIDSINARFSVY